jgi:hypothetical protein
MALTKITLRPTSQPGGNGFWTLTGAATAWQALADSSDTSYVSTVARCRLDQEVLRLKFSAPSIPAGAKVYSVGLRRRIQTVVEGTPVPQCHHWFRSTIGSFIGFITSLIIPPETFLFHTLCPTDPSATSWVEEDCGQYFAAPDGSAWDPTTNLNGLYYDMGRGDDNGNPLYVSAVYLDVTYQRVSTVTVTGPTGTNGDTRPTILWTYASPDSLPELKWRTAIYTQAQVAAPGFVAFSTAPIQESGWVQSEDLQWTLDHDLVNGSYAAYVQVEASWAGPGDFLTNIASTTWTRDASTPTTPGPTLTPPPAAVLSSAVFDATNSRVVLTMVPSSSSPTTAAYTVEASRDGGLSFDPIPSLTYVAATGMTPLVVSDYAAPINVTSQYRVMAFSQPGSTLASAAAYSNTLSCTTSGTDWWLKDPANPLGNTIIPVFKTGNKITRKRVQGTFDLLSTAGSVNKIVVSGPVYGEEGELVLFFEHDQAADYWAAYDLLDRSGHTLLLQKPDGEQLFIVLGPGSSATDTKIEYDALPGHPNIIQYRKITTSYTQVDPPAYY